MQTHWMLFGMTCIGLLWLTTPSEACNEAICAPQVSKCMLIKSCDCDMSNKKNCTCCKDCQVCLAGLYFDCCTCVGMCPELSPKEQLYKTSTVEDLLEPIPELFGVLTDEEDKFLRWTRYTYPSHLDLYLKPNTKGIIVIDVKSGKYRHKYNSVQDTEQEIEKKQGIADEDNEADNNCTVAFMSQCMSLNRCKVSCKSMGAARYRWFHEYGCCQCIGSTCLGYGKNEPVCLKCPEPEEEDEKASVLGFEKKMDTAAVNSQVDSLPDGIN